MAKADLTAARLREVLDYAPDTGVFTWKVATSIRTLGKIGKPAGCLCKQQRYIKIRLDTVCYQAHRLAWFFVNDVMPVGDIDHKNGVRSDNRISNLRLVSRSVNMQNERRARETSKTGLLGVEAHESGRFTARIRTPGGGPRIYLGRFDAPEEAHEAYMAAKRRLHPGCTL